MRFNTNDSLQQFAVGSSDRQVQLLVYHIRRCYFLDALTVEIKQMAKPDIMHLLVAVWNYRIQLRTNQILSFYADHLAEARTDFVDDQLAAASIMQSQYAVQGLATLNWT